MNTSILNDFCRIWISLFSHSAKARLAWQVRTGLSCPSYSPTRWWSRFEVIQHLLKSFGDIKGFLEEDDIPPGTASKLLEILNDAGRLRKLKMEMAITVDALESFVKCTYDLEGDGASVLIAYKHIRALFRHVSLKHYPNVIAVAKELSGSNSTHVLTLRVA